MYTGVQQGSHAAHKDIFTNIALHVCIIYIRNTINIRSMMKKSWFLVSVLAVFLFVSTAEAKTTTVTEDLNLTHSMDAIADESGAWFASDARIKKNGGEMALAHLATDQNTVKVYVYSNNTDSWNSASITTDPIEGAETVKAYNIDIVALRTNWTVSFMAKHFDADDNLVGISYEANNIGRGGAESVTLRDSLFFGGDDSIWGTDLNLIVDNADDAYFKIFPRSQTGSNSYWVVWREDGKLHTIDWMIDTSSDFSLVTLGEKKVDPEKNFFVLPSTSENGSVGAGSGIYFVGVADNDVVVTKTYEGEKSSVATISGKKKTTVLDARWGDTDSIHILFKRKGYVRSAIVNISEKTATTPERIAKKKGFRSGRYAVAYNDYGKGQYIVSWHKGKNKTYYKMWKGSTGWQEKGSFGGKAGVQDIYTYKDGTIQIICKYGDRWYDAFYRPDTKEWDAEVTWLKKSYDDVRFSWLLDSTRSEDGSDYYTQMRDRETLDDSKIYAWEVGEETPYGVLDASNNYTYMNHIAKHRYDQEWYFVVLSDYNVVSEQGTVKVILGQKENLFK